jgi:hypothetical protein
VEETGSGKREEEKRAHCAGPDSKSAAIVLSEEIA